MNPTRPRPTALRNLAMVLATPIVAEEVELGRQVFHNFVHQEFEHQGLSDAEIIEEDEFVDENGFVDENFAMAHREVFHGRNLAGTPEGYKTVAISQVGSVIRELANEFARSHQRQAIQKEADEVDLSALTLDRFQGLLEEVFRNGMTSHNLIALFFFCSDVLIRCVKLKLREIGMNLFRWSLMYITNRVVQWVHDNGGWENALRTAMDHLARKKKIIATVGIVVLAVGSYYFIQGLRK